MMDTRAFGKLPAGSHAQDIGDTIGRVYRSGVRMSNAWWKDPFLALTRHALAQPGLRAGAGTATLFKALSRIYDDTLREADARAEHGFVKPPITEVAAFMIDGDMIVVRNAQGRMKAIHSYSMRGYIRAARAKPAHGG